MKKTRMKLLGCAAVLGMALILSACGGSNASQPPDSSLIPQTPPDGGANEVTGLFASATEDTLVIELVDMPEMAGGPPEGAPDQSGMPKPGEDGPPEGMEPPDSAALPPDGSAPAGGGPPEGGMPAVEPTGETMELHITGSTTITETGGTESLTLSSLEAGEMLRVTLDEDGATAVSILVMRQTRGEQGA